MATSGTVGQTSVDVVQLVESAARRCGKLAASLTSEQLQISRLCMHWAITELSTNRGLSLWAVTKLILPVETGRAEYPLPAGVERVLTPLLRSGNYSAGAPSSVTFAANTAVVSAVATVSLAGTYVLAIDSSPDGATWTERGTSFSWALPSSNLHLGVQCRTFPATLRWRVRLVSSPVGATITESSFAYAATDLPMSLLNRDSYANLPNKTFSTSKPLQIYFDRQEPNPSISLWGVPNVAGPQLVLYTRRAVQDVGDLTDALELPARWQLALTLGLATHLMDELPANEVDRSRLPDLAVKYASALSNAEAEETDGSPLVLLPSVGGYTR